MHRDQLLRCGADADAPPPSCGGIRGVGCGSTSGHPAHCGIWLGYCYGDVTAGTSVTSAFPILRLHLLSSQGHRHTLRSAPQVLGGTLISRGALGQLRLRLHCIVTCVSGLRTGGTSALVEHRGSASHLWCSLGPGSAQPFSHFMVGTHAPPALRTLQYIRVGGAPWARVAPMVQPGA